MNKRFLTVTPALFTAVLVFGGTSFPVAHAAQIAPSGGCYTFARDIRLGQQDTAFSNDVDSLQRFLAGKGYFESASLGSGHFGPLTKRAVARFQADQGVSATGYFGPLSRAVTAKLYASCSGPSAPSVPTTPTTPPVKPSNPVGPSAPTKPSSPVVPGGPTVSTTQIYSLSPDRAAIGDTVSITGSGFSGMNTILIDGMFAAKAFATISTTNVMCAMDTPCRGDVQESLTFTIPSSLSPYCESGQACPMIARLLTPGTYPVTVKNGSGVSNSVNLTITK